MMKGKAEKSQVDKIENWQKRHVDETPGYKMTSWRNYKLKKQKNGKKKCWWNCKF